MSPRRSRPVLVMAASVTLFVSACSAGTSATTPSSASETTVGTSAGSIEGTFDVGGYSLFIKCEGTGSPTIVYLHAAISEPSIDPHLNGLAIQRALQDDYRVCVYDRRNLGHSDTVDAVQTPDDAMNDMRNLLRAAEVDPPYGSSAPRWAVSSRTGDYGQDPEYNELILDLQAEYVDRFSPGTYIRVAAPHLMESAIPDEILEALRNVIGKVGF